jgi:dihydrolipoamide dehydrogenase
MPHYDVVILGAGPGGYVAAVRSAQLGLSTAIIEEKYWGGICLNVGASSKSLLKNAEIAHTFTHKAEFFGISGDVHFDFGAAFDRSRKVADTRVKGIHFLMKKNKVTEYDGRGTFTGPRRSPWRSPTARPKRSRSTTSSSRPDPPSVCCRACS